VEYLPQLTFPPVQVRGEACLLILEFGETTDMMNPAPFVQSGDGLGSGEYTAARAHRRVGDVAIDGAQRVFDHIAALIDLRDYPVGAVRVISVDRFRAHPAGS
jgi:hypothetical protein